MGKTYPGGVDLSTWEQGYYTAIDDNTGKRVKVHVRKGEPRPKIYNNMYLPMYSDGKGNFYSYIPEGMVSLNRPWSERELLVQNINQILKKGGLSKQGAELALDTYDSEKGHENPLKEAVVIAKANHPEIIEWQEARKAELDKLVKQLDTEQNIRASLNTMKGDRQTERMFQLYDPVVIAARGGSDYQEYDMLNKYPYFGEVTKFYKEDVQPRMIRAWRDEGLLNQQRYNVIMSNPLTRYKFYTNPVFETVMGTAGGYVPSMKPRYVALSTRNGGLDPSVVAHETDHIQRFELGNIGAGGLGLSYTPKERKLLREAYDYSFLRSLLSNDLIGMFGAVGPVEKSSANREIRYKLYQESGGLTDSDLDNYIDQMSDEDLFKTYFREPYVNRIFTQWNEAEEKRQRDLAHLRFGQNISHYGFGKHREGVGNPKKAAIKALDKARELQKSTSFDSIIQELGPEKIHDLMQKVRAALKYVADNKPSSDQQPNNYNIT